LNTKSIFVLAFTACLHAHVYATEAVNFTPLAQQNLTTTFKRGDIKFDWDCNGKVTKTQCTNGSPNSIEVTAYATSNGAGDMAREVAFRVAEAKAKAKLRHFLHEEVTSSRVITTLSKNLEKADDRLRNGLSPSTTSMSDDEALRDSSYVIRENTNSVARTMTETIRARASGIMRGIYVHEAKVVDKQTVGVTIRWDKNSDQFSQKMRFNFDQ
jgi:hypothetical protein